jgi:hypothetical protein
MKQRRRIYYSVAQRSEIWDRWQAGESMNWAPVRPRVVLGDLSGWRHSSCRAAADFHIAESGRAGGDIARAQHAVFVALSWSPERIAGWLKRTHPRGGAPSGVARDHLP